MTEAGSNGIWDAVVADPMSSALFLDFDGTLAPIVDDPDQAELPEGFESVLAELAQRLGRLVVVTGRSLEFLRSRLPDTVDMIGLYGLELFVDGKRIDHEQSGSWREVVDHVAAAARGAGPAGMRVEPKGLSVTLHYREHPELAAQVREMAQAQANRSGLELRLAKMSVELHPPIEVDKGTAVRDVLDQGGEDFHVAVYIGDDVGDLPAFEALGSSELAERDVYRVAVGGIECPPELREAADILLDSPAAVEEQLIDLRDRLLTKTSP